MLRFGNGKCRKKFQYLIPAVLMELPGDWVSLTGFIDAEGLKIESLVIQDEYPDCTLKYEMEYMAS